MTVETSVPDETSAVEATATGADAQVGCCDAAGEPCCGTVAEAAAGGSCCGGAAKAEAVAAGTGCCG